MNTSIKRMKKQLLLCTILSASLHMTNAAEFNRDEYFQLRSPGQLTECQSAIRRGELKNFVNHVASVGAISPLVELSSDQVRQLDLIINYGEMVICGDPTDKIIGTKLINCGVLRFKSQNPIASSPLSSKFASFQNHGEIHVNSDFVLQTHYFNNNRGTIQAKQSVLLKVLDLQLEPIQGRIFAHDIVLESATPGKLRVGGELTTRGQFKVSSPTGFDLLKGAKIYLGGNARIEAPEFTVDGVIEHTNKTSSEDQQLLSVQRNLTVNATGRIHGTILTHLRGDRGVSYPSVGATFINKGMCVFEEIWDFSKSVHYAGTRIINSGGYIRQCRRSGASNQPLVLQNNEGVFLSEQSVDVSYTEEYLNTLHGHISGDIRTAGKLNLTATPRTSFRPVICGATLVAKDSVHINVGAGVLHIPSAKTVISSEKGDVHCEASEINVGEEVCIRSGNAVRFGSKVNFNLQGQVTGIDACKSITINGVIVSPKVRLAFSAIAGKGTLSASDVKLQVNGSDKSEAFTLNDQMPGLVDTHQLSIISGRKVKIERPIDIQGRLCIKTPSLSIKRKTSAKTGIVFKARELRMNDEGSLKTNGDLVIDASIYNMKTKGSKPIDWEANRMILSGYKISSNDEITLPKTVNLFSPDILIVHPNKINFNATGTFENLSLQALHIDINGKPITASGKVRLEGSSVHASATLQAKELRVECGQLIASEIKTDALSVVAQFLDGTDSRVSSTSGRMNVKDMHAKRMELAGHLMIEGEGRHEIKDLHGKDATLIHRAGTVVFEGQNSVGIYIPDSDVTTLSSEASLRVKSMTYARELMKVQSASNSVVAVDLERYEYTSIDIAELLNIAINAGQPPIAEAFTLDGSDVIGHTIYRKNHRYILPAITSSGADSPHLQLLEYLRQFYAHPTVVAHSPTELLIPFNPGGHWVVLRVEIPLTGNIQVSYIDSLLRDNLCSAEKAELDQSMIEEFKDILTYLSNHHGSRHSEMRRVLGLIQPNAYACGTTTVEHIKKLWASEPISKIELTRNQILKFRKMHFDQLKTAGLSFDGAIGVHNKDLYLYGNLEVEEDQLVLRPGGKVVVTGSVSRTDKASFQRVHVEGREGVVCSSLDAEFATLVFEERLKLYSNQLLVKKLGIRADELEMEHVTIRGEELALKARRLLLDQLCLRVDDVDLSAEEAAVLSELDSVGDRFNVTAGSTLQMDQFRGRGQTLTTAAGSQTLNNVTLRFNETSLASEHDVTANNLSSMGYRFDSSGNRIRITGKVEAQTGVSLDAGKQGVLDAVDLDVTSEGMLLMRAQDSTKINPRRLAAKQAVMDFETYQNGVDGAIKLANDLSLCERVHVDARNYALNVLQATHWRPNMALVVAKANVMAPLSSDGDLGIHSMNGINICDSIFARNIDLLAEQGDINFYLGLVEFAFRSKFFGKHKIKLRDPREVRAADSLSAKALAGSINVVGGTLSGGSRVGLDARNNIGIVGSGLEESYQPAHIEGGTGILTSGQRIQRGADGNPIVAADGGIAMEAKVANVGVDLRAGGTISLGASHVTSLSDIRIDAKKGLEIKPYVYYEVQTHSKTRGGLFRTKTTTTIVIPHVHKSNISALGTIYAEAEEGGVRSTGADFVSGGGTYILARDGVDIRDVIAESSTTTTKSSGFLSPGFIQTSGSSASHSRELNVPVHLLSQREIYLRSKEGAIYGRGVLIQTPDAVILQAPKGIELTLPILEEIIEQTSWAISAGNPAVNAAIALLKGEGPGSAAAALEPLAAHIDKLSKDKSHFGQNLTRASISAFNDLHALSQAKDYKTFFGQRYGLTNAQGEFSPSVSIGYSESFSKTVMHHVGMGGLMARTAYFLTEGDLKVSNAFPVDITENAYIKAENFYLTGAKLDFNHEEDQWGVHVTFGGKALVSVGGNYAMQEGAGHTWAHGRFAVGGVLDAQVRNLIEIQGAQITAAKLRGSAKKIRIVSVTDEAESNGMSVAGSVSWSGGWSFSVSGSFNSSSSKGISQRAGIYLRDSLNEHEDEFRVLDSTTLVGGVIQSDGFMRWISETVEGISIEEHAESEAVAAGISTNPNAAISGELSFNYANSNYKATAHACITGRTGTEIKGKIIGKVVTDPSKARDVTEDSSVEFGFVIPLTTPERLSAAMDDIAASSPFSKPWDAKPASDSLVTESMLGAQSDDSRDDSQDELTVEQIGNITKSRTKALIQKILDESTSSGGGQFESKILKTNALDIVVLKVTLDSMDERDRVKIEAIDSGLLDTLSKGYNKIITNLNQFGKDIQDELLKMSEFGAARLGQFWENIRDNFSKIMEAGGRVQSENLKIRTNAEYRNGYLWGTAAGLAVGAVAIPALTQPAITFPLLSSMTVEQVSLLCGYSETTAKGLGIMAGGGVRAGLEKLGRDVAAKYIAVESFELAVQKLMLDFGSSNSVATSFGGGVGTIVQEITTQQSGKIKVNPRTVGGAMIAKGIGSMIQERAFPAIQRDIENTLPAELHTLKPCIESIAKSLISISYATGLKSTVKTFGEYKVDNAIQASRIGLPLTKAGFRDRALWLYLEGSVKLTDLTPSTHPARSKD